MHETILILFSEQMMHAFQSKIALLNQIYGARAGFSTNLGCDSELLTLRIKHVVIIRLCTTDVCEAVDR